MLSSRTPANLQPNLLAAARARLPAPLFDLTVSNPTRCELPYPPDLLEPLADRRGLAYDPDPRGLDLARAAVAAELARQGAAVAPERLLLTASTSEAYAFLFKLLCDPGEAVAVPAPSYPLLEHLARAEAVATVAYPLLEEAAWRLDLDALAAAPDGVRAVVVVHPNNPTGSFVHPDDQAALAELCLRRAWALIADEVFLDYPLHAPRPSVLERASCLTFALGGLSKSAGLPQLKLAWIAAGGPRELVEPALARLELIADTFLSVATPVQLALPSLLQAAAPVRRAIAARCGANLERLRRVLAPHPSLTVLEPEGGWSAPLRFPAVVGEEELALSLLEDESVAVQPGYFYDFAREGVVVVSLLPPEAAFAAGAARLAARLGRLG